MFKKILIANRSEIAVRIINACHILDIKAVAIYSAADALSRHVSKADEAYQLEGDSHRVYLDGEQIVRVAKKAGANAIHPGYGFLSENPDFAQLCLNANVIFIGPKPEVLRRMGSKVESRRAMESAGVPVVPGTTEPVSDLETMKELAQRFGYPIAIKASAGGGGRGLKVANQESEVDAALASAVREGESYFGNGEVYMEKYLGSPRHIEVQILADEHGNVLHLGERDCSSQRRHQKLLEESPAVNLPRQLQEQLLNAAVLGARSIGYTSAGTFEGLVSGDKYYFLEANTRIQVEHPVTELVTGIDIVKEQILIASGERLSFKQEDIQFRGHAIECRINAEDPYKSFLPNPGVISLYQEPNQPWVRIDSACYQGWNVLPFYDSLLAKLVVWGKDREEAISRAKAALRDFRIEGIATNIPFHLYLLDSAEFVEGSIDTALIEREMLHNFLQSSAPTPLATSASPEVISASHITKGFEPSLDSIRNFNVQVNGKTLRVTVSELGRSERIPPASRKEPPVMRDDFTAHATRLEGIADGAQTVTSPMHGLIKRLNVALNDKVSKGQVLLIFDAMKMETEIMAQISGKISSLNVKTGETVGSGQVLLTISP